MTLTKCSARRFRRLFCALVASLLPTLATAWGFEAHRLIADLAQRQLTGKARADIDGLLALEPDSTLGVDLDVGRHQPHANHQRMALRQPAT
jgi:hypothetical protein